MLFFLNLLDTTDSGFLLQKTGLAERHGDEDAEFSLI